MNIPNDLKSQLSNALLKRTSGAGVKLSARSGNDGQNLTKIETISEPESMEIKRSIDDNNSNIQKSGAFSGILDSTMARHKILLGKQINRQSRNLIKGNSSDTPGDHFVTLETEFSLTENNDYLTSFDSEKTSPLSLVVVKSVVEVPILDVNSETLSITQSSADIQNSDVSTGGSKCDQGTSSQHFSVTTICALPDSSIDNSSIQSPTKVLPTIKRTVTSKVPPSVLPKPKPPPVLPKPSKLAISVNHSNVKDENKGENIPTLRKASQIQEIQLEVTTSSSTIVSETNSEMKVISTSSTSNSISLDEFGNYVRTKRTSITFIGSPPNETEIIASSLKELELKKEPGNDVSTRENYGNIQSNATNLTTCASEAENKKVESHVLLLNDSKNLEISTETCLEEVPGVSREESESSVNSESSCLNCLNLKDPATDKNIQANENTLTSSRNGNEPKSPITFRRKFSYPIDNEKPANLRRVSLPATSRVSENINRLIKQLHESISDSKPINFTETSLDQTKQQTTNNKPLKRNSFYFDSSSISRNQKKQSLPFFPSISKEPKHDNEVDNLDTTETSKKSVTEHVSDRL